MTTPTSLIDYKAMKVGDRARMTEANDWNGENQQFYRMVQDYCTSLPDEGRPQFQVETVRQPGQQIQFWFERVR